MGIWVIPTDTVYGLVASASDSESVEKIYQIKHRNSAKPLIILINHLEQLDDFGVVLSEQQQQFLQNTWPGQVSIILDAPDAPKYLHRDTESLAFRMPDDSFTQHFIDEHGPIVAPSANPEAKPTANSIAEAMAYFGDSVDEYIDGGIRSGKSSRLIKLHANGEVEVLRD